MAKLQKWAKVKCYYEIDDHQELLLASKVSREFIQTVHFPAVIQMGRQQMFCRLQPKVCHKACYAVTQIMCHTNTNNMSHKPSKAKKTNLSDNSYLSSHLVLAVMS